MVAFGGSLLLDWWPWINVSLQCLKLGAHGGVALVAVCQEALFLTATRVGWIWLPRVSRTMGKLVSYSV